MPLHFFGDAARLTIRVTRLLGSLLTVAAAGTVLLLPPGAAASTQAGGPTRTSQQLKRDVLIHADMWARKPRMMAAGLGFTNIIGVPGMNANDLAASEQAVREAGGAWDRLSCAETPALGDYTSAASPSSVAYSYGYPTTYSDGLPVEFSWPILPSSLDAGDFRVTLNDGTVVKPELAAVYPNFEYNERSVAVLFGHFGNRLPPSDPRSRYVVRTQVVRGSTPLRLVGPHDRIVSAVGMSAEATTTPYANPNTAPSERTGPRLAAAKLSRMSTKGESAPPAFRGFLPNDGVALYGKAARFRLRIYTTGGFSPDGVLGIHPDEYQRYFRIVARRKSGRRVLISKVGKRYRLGGAHLRVLGLADLGRKQSSYDDCYAEDHDNQIDIVLAGRKRAMERIRRIQIPGSGRYDPLYNPGGPGNDPTPGVRYTAPSPRISQRVLNALDDPMTVTYRPGSAR
jgi:hypothetical protein